MEYPNYDDEFEKRETYFLEVYFYKQLLLNHFGNALDTSFKKICNFQNL